MRIQKSFADDQTGMLYLVATPIGNLEDITFRAIRILREADLIAAEDTRQTRKLLAHYDIHTRLVSYHEHNKHASGPELVRLMEDGLKVALVSDAGMPAISDPGEELVRLAIEHDIPVVPVPGANAGLSALIASGLSARGFRFVGFPPREKGKLLALLTEWKQERDTLIFYESPHRVVQTLEAIGQVMGNRSIVLARELTKRHEEFARGTVEECLAFLGEHPPVGEYCVLVSGADEQEAEESASIWWKDMSVDEHVKHYMDSGMDKKTAMKQAARDRGVPKREIYNQLLLD